MSDIRTIHCRKIMEVAGGKESDSDYNIS